MVISKKEQRNRWFSIAILGCVYLICASMPFSLFIKDEMWCFIATLILKSAFFVFAFFYIKKEKLFTKHISKPKIADLLFIPLLLICMSNFMYAFIMQPGTRDINGTSLVKASILTLFITLSEELVFRTILLEEFLSNTKLKPIYSILITSGIFGLTHLVNISSLESIPTVLMQCGYAFVIGLLFSFVYYERRNIIYPFIFHFLFNFLNNDLYGEMFTINYGWEYYLINIAVGFIVLVYAFLLYLFLEKKKEITHAS